tara:strand:- start:143 stop:298 length:156 start_codon:yes stop_codon:yes gene_type:complete
MNEKEQNPPPPPPLNMDRMKKSLEHMLKSAPTEEIRKKVQSQIDELNKKNN